MPPTAGSTSRLPRITAGFSERPVALRYARSVGMSQGVLVTLALPPDPSSDQRLALCRLAAGLVAQVAIHARQLIPRHERNLATGMSVRPHRGRG